MSEICFIPTQILCAVEIGKNYSAGLRMTFRQKSELNFKNSSRVRVRVRVRDGIGGWG